MINELNHRGTEAQRQELPILFTTEMVKGVLENRKTQTRRLVTPQPTEYGLQWATACGGEFRAWQDDGLELGEGKQRLCPFGERGDLLWVRETWRLFDRSECTHYDENAMYCNCGASHGLPVYKADSDPSDECKWKPSIHMPKKFARIWLEVCDVRVERVQDITEADAQAEGMIPGRYGVGWIPAAQREPYAYAFAVLWDGIYGKRGFGWEKNPWVWVIDFEQVKGPHYE